ncbi:MAG: phosphate ABC transporter substrate-binding protein PstS [Solirubrobacteraceae bacterium]|jgi:phosphate transport system substrate-binding protein
MHRTTIRFAVVAAAAAAALCASASAATATTLTGAGSTLVQPMVQDVWAPDFAAANSGDSVTYNGVGSGTGITDIGNKSVDFGASDAPMTSTQDSGCNGCVEIPWALAATGLDYNLSGISKLNLSGPVIAQIFLGQITNWDDPAIAKLNKGVTLPNEKITPVVRSDGSGDTYVFTSYLSQISSTWASQVGSATTVQWPTGDVGAAKNAGVAAVVSSTAGAIGNNSWFYIQQNHLSAVSVENNAGNFLLPYDPYVAAAAAVALTGKTLPALNTLSSSTAGSIASAYSLVNPSWTAPKKSQCIKFKVVKHHKTKTCKTYKLTKLEKEQFIAYPMATFTYAIVRPDDANVGLLQKFLTFAITTAEEKKGAGFQFAPLPTAVFNVDTTAINGL